MIKIIIKIIHLLLILYIGLYGFIIKKNVGDYLILFIIYLLLVHWTLLNGECIITYNEKRINDNNYIPGKELFKADNIFIYFLTRSILILINIITLSTFYIVFIRNNFSKGLALIFIFIFEIYYFGLYFFKDHYKNKNYFKFQTFIQIMILTWTVYFYCKYNHMILT